ncbi:unnamed protein product [Ambrosiozyma monospora]|uniref:Unnamed protein product n=1 Tax=Ambrosiozyma monospora TaxID=43982 RepID=A0ACB5U5T9_AMBMO|nr:unnamed protein product [Ambrosiozyma monospora]
MTFTNEYNIPAGQTGDLVTATYTDVDNCKDVPTSKLQTLCSAKEDKPECITSDVPVESTSCPIWTMTFTNEYNIPPGQTGDLVTATYTDAANCKVTTTNERQTLCPVGNKKVKRDDKVTSCTASVGTTKSQSCPIWTMTFTNVYNVPAGQTGDLVTATYTDAQNCKDVDSPFTTSSCWEVTPPPVTSCDVKTVSSDVTTCPIWTMTFTNEYNIPPGQTGDLVTATYTDTANCKTIPTTEVQTVCPTTAKKVKRNNDATCSQQVITTQTNSCPIWTMTFTNEYNVPTDKTGDLVTATYTDTANCKNVDATVTTSTCWKSGDAKATPTPNGDDFYCLPI